MNPNYLKIINGRIFTPEGWINNGTIVIYQGKIIEITNKNIEIDGAEIINADGNYVTPGCIDMHVHGGGGHDFMEATPESFITIAETHARYGTTSLYPTLAVSPRKTFYQAFDSFEKVKSMPHRGANLLGIHLEGNYLNIKYKGGQDPRYICLPDPAEYQQMLEYTQCIKRWSASPELEGATEFARYATAKGVLVALAHTDADYQEVLAGFESGFTHATHFYNAMRGVHKDREFKKEGTIESIYLIDDLTVEIIADGVHLPPSILKLVHKIKGTARTALITDCMAAGGAPEGTQCFDQRVIIEDGVAKLSDRSALAGSIATMDLLLRTLIRKADIPLEDAIRMATETPAHIMHIQDKKGSLQVGKDADIIVFDNNILIKNTIVNGEIVFDREGGL